MKDTKVSFKGQKIYCGIDVHKRQWVVVIYAESTFCKRMTVAPKPRVLVNYLEKHYPEGTYYSVYEAGFSGYWAHRELVGLGVRNIVINPADVPTNTKERLMKTDTIDAGKLAQGLLGGRLNGIYVPTPEEEELRALCRQRYYLSCDGVRLKNRIKSYLNYRGIGYPGEEECKNWSRAFIQYLKDLPIEDQNGKYVIECWLRKHDENKQELLRVNQALHKAICRGKYSLVYERLHTSVPGIGKLTAATLICELIDMHRFRTMEKLACYVGLVPMSKSSGERQSNEGLTVRSNQYIRRLLIEAAWKAVQKDPAMTQVFNEMCKRKKKTRAIISIARKLLSRVRHVWLIGEAYECGVVR